METALNVLYSGNELNCDKLCGVSILRAGEAMEQAVCDVLKNVRIGKILIQTNPTTNEPEVPLDLLLFRLMHDLIVYSLLQLYYLRLPKDIKDYKVILMDATVASGAAAMMAIRILLDHEVPEENIMLCSLLMAVSGVHSIAYAFPKVLMITTEVDPEVNDKFYILPGIGMPH